MCGCRCEETSCTCKCRAQVNGVIENDKLHYLNWTFLQTRPYILIDLPVQPRPRRLVIYWAWSSSQHHRDSNIEWHKLRKQQYWMSQLLNSKELEERDLSLTILFFTNSISSLNRYINILYSKKIINSIVIYESWLFRDIIPCHFIGLLWLTWNSTQRLHTRFFIRPQACSDEEVLCSWQGYQ